MNSPSSVKALTAPIAAPFVSVGRMIEQTGNMRLRKMVGSGMIRLVWKSSPPKGEALRFGAGIWLFGQFVDRYATDLGLVFQIVDDILDVEGETGELGKTAGKDAAGAKPTYPALFGLERSRDFANHCVTRARQTLAEAGLTRGWLADIADWVVSRRS